MSSSSSASSSVASVLQALSKSGDILSGRIPASQTSLPAPQVAQAPAGAPEVPERAGQDPAKVSGVSDDARARNAPEVEQASFGSLTRLVQQDPEAWKLVMKECAPQINAILAKRRSAGALHASQDESAEADAAQQDCARKAKRAQCEEVPQQIKSRLRRKVSAYKKLVVAAAKAWAALTPSGLNSTKIPSPLKEDAWFWETLLRKNSGWIKFAPEALKDKAWFWSLAVSDCKKWESADEGPGELMPPGLADVFYAGMDAGMRDCGKRLGYLVKNGDVTFSNDKIPLSLPWLMNNYSDSDSDSDGDAQTKRTAKAELAAKQACGVIKEAAKTAVEFVYANVDRGVDSVNLKECMQSLTYSNHACAKVYKQLMHKDTRDTIVYIPPEFDRTAFFAKQMRYVMDNGKSLDSIDLDMASDEVRTMVEFGMHLGARNKNVPSDSDIFSDEVEEKALAGKRKAEDARDEQHSSKRAKTATAARD